MWKFQDMKMNLFPKWENSTAAAQFPGNSVVAYFWVTLSASMHSCKLCTCKLCILYFIPGEGTRLSCGRGGGGGGCGWKSKTLPCRNALGAQKIHPVTIYLTKKFKCIPCRNIAPSLVPTSRACQKRGLGSPGNQPCDKWSSPPVAN